MEQLGRIINKDVILQQMAALMSKKLTIFTIGHSTHPIDEFIAILKHYHIAELVDIPQFLNRAIIHSSMALILHMNFAAIILAIGTKKI